MPEYYTEASVVTEKFLFISYSHEEKSLIRTAANWLIGEGVRLWYDADLHNGDNWIDVAKRMLTHENCIGAIFFNSVNAYISDSIAEERQLALNKKKEWEQAGKTFYVFVVNIGKPSTLRLIKQTFDTLPDNDSFLRRAFTTAQLSVILELFDDTKIYSYIDDEDPDGYLQPLFDDLSKRAPQVINKSLIAVEELGRLSKNAGISFKLGRHKLGGEMTSLEWQFLCCDEDNNGIFLLKQLLPDRLGSGLTEWLNGEFLTGAFTEEEKAKLTGRIRLLWAKETEGVSAKLMQIDHPWWLADVDGALQKVVREDGTVYNRGSINTRIQRGVRPVITVDMNTAKDLMG